jgi:DNA-binding transcriptional LysR family regulator
MPLAPRIPLDHWRALVAVVAEGGYAPAAKALHKSQSAVTYAVQQLQARLGVEIFRLEGRRARLTPTGEQLYRRARVLLEEAAALEKSAQRLAAGWEAEVRVAADVIFPTWLLLGCLDRLGAESPDTRVELIESVIGHRTDVLERGLADLAIFGSVPPGFLGEPLTRARFLLVAHPDHALHRLGRDLTLRDLREHRHLVVRESSPDRASAPLLEADRRWTVSHVETSIEAARSGYGYAMLPEDRIRDDLRAGTLKALPMRAGGERYTELYLILADAEGAGPATRRLAALVREEVARQCRRA